MGAIRRLVTYDLMEQILSFVTLAGRDRWAIVWGRPQWMSEGQTDSLKSMYYTCSRHLTQTNTDCLTPTFQILLESWAGPSPSSACNYCRWGLRSSEPWSSTLCSCHCPPGSWPAAARKRARSVALKSWRYQVIHLMWVPESRRPAPSLRNDPWS